jgi:hypothetical protein
MTEPIALQEALLTVYGELMDGAAADVAWVLNRQDPGLLRSLEKLSARQASVVVPGGRASIAAHVDHLRYGLELLNRWNHGEDPWDTANFSASWQRITVTDREWSVRLDELRSAAYAWRQAIEHPREMDQTALTNMVASVVHLAYHLGAVRQMDRSIRGPAAQD